MRNRAVCGSIPERDCLPEREGGLTGERARLRLTTTVDSLMNRWCKRGAVKPLQILLRAYPGPLWHAYHRMELLECLETLNGSKDELLPEERSMLSDSLDLLRGRHAGPMGIDPSIEIACE